MIALAIVCGCGDGAAPPANVTPKIITGDVPCAPNQVLVNVCQNCHTTPTQHGAPFQLVTFNDVHQELDGKPIWFWMEKFLTTRDMPLPPIDIAEQDRTTLLEWVRAGAPSGDPTCP